MTIFYKEVKDLISVMPIYSYSVCFFPGRQYTLKYNAEALEGRQTQEVDSGER
jgi:hypothetical protein